MHNNWQEFLILSRSHFQSDRKSKSLVWSSVMLGQEKGKMKNENESIQ